MVYWVERGFDTWTVLTSEISFKFSVYSAGVALATNLLGEGKQDMKRRDQQGIVVYMGTTPLTTHRAKRAQLPLRNKGVHFFFGDNPTNLSKERKRQCKGKTYLSCQKTQSCFKGTGLELSAATALLSDPPTVLLGSKDSTREAAWAMAKAPEPCWKTMDEGICLDMTGSERRESRVGKN